MKEILKAPKGIAENLSAIEKFVFVLNELKNDSVVKTFSNKINERISKIRKSVNAISVECDKIASRVGPSLRRRFDIMRPDGSIEIGLFAESEEWLRDEFKDTGEEDIQILREIDEYGCIVRENEPHHPVGKFLGVMRPGKTVGSVNPVLSKKEDKEIEGFLQSEYERFQEDPEEYRSPSAMEQEKNDAKAEAEAANHMMRIHERNHKTAEGMSEIDFLKRMEIEAREANDFLNAIPETAKDSDMKTDEDPAKDSDKDFKKERKSRRTPKKPKKDPEK